MEIWEHDFFSNVSKQLTNYSGRDFAPRYSPDGKSIAFVTEIATIDNQSDLEIYIMNSDGSNIKRAITNYGADRHVSWSPDGKYLIYTSAKNQSGAERITVTEMGKFKPAEIKFDRYKLDMEFDTEPKNYMRVFPLNMLPIDWIRNWFYPMSYFGSEKSPDWKF